MLKKSKIDGIETCVLVPGSETGTARSSYVEYTAVCETEIIFNCNNNLCSISAGARW
jgi:hypothetical protein